MLSMIQVNTSMRVGVWKWLAHTDYLLSKGGKSHINIFTGFQIKLRKWKDFNLTHIQTVTLNFLLQWLINMEHYRTSDEISVIPSNSYVFLTISSSSYLTSVSLWYSCHHTCLCCFISVCSLDIFEVNIAFLI